jgi:hypothetical protein
MGENDELTGKVYWIGALAIGLAAIWLHLTFLTHAGGLWRDEINLLNLAKLPALSGLRQDSFPVAMPLLVRAWAACRLGRTDFELRCLGVLLGMGLLAAFWVAAWITKRAPPLLGMAFMALNATALTYGDTLRAYGLGSLLIVLAMAATWAFLAKSTPVRFACMTALMVASVQTLFHNAALVGAICCGAWAVCASRKARREAVLVLAAGAAAAVSLLPYLANVVSALDSTAGWRTGFRPKFTLLDLRSAIGFPHERYVCLWALFVLVAVGSGVGCLLRRASARDGAEGSSPLDVTDRPYQTDRDRIIGGGQQKVQVFAAVTIIAALIGFGAFLWYAGLATQPWYFLPLMALVAACFDAGLPPLHRYLGMALLVFAAGTALFAFPLARVSALSRFTNVDLLARKIMTEAAPEDYVVVTPWFCGISFDHYFHGPASWSTLPPLEDHRFHRFDLISAKLQRKDAIQPVLDRIAATLQAGHRVWLVGWIEILPPGTPPPPDLPPPPLKGWGWSQTPYTENWDAKLESYLGAHSRAFEMVEVPASSDVNPNEDLKLARAEGCK